MNEANINYGQFVLNDSPIGPYATIAATGMGRSGTTMIARILKELGLQMDYSRPEGSQDDKEIQDLVIRDRWEEFEAVCRRRDGENAVWGFKSPKIRKDLARTAGVLRAPRFIVTFRDVLAIALRNNISVHADVTEAMRLAIKGYVHILQQIDHLEVPILLVSYEKALLFPEQAVSRIAAFTGFEVNAPAVTRIAEQTIIASDPRYLAIK